MISIYRFRGGTVDCMVTFKKACVNVFSIEPEEVAVKYLNSNYRSHPNIVNYYDDYIKSFKSMRLEGARVEGKPSLRPKVKLQVIIRQSPYYGQNYRNYWEDLQYWLKTSWKIKLLNNRVNVHYS